jgi:putative photosynthetic complex assembly protein 2
MSQIALPVLFALLLWWFSTGIILYVVGLASWTYRVSVTISAALLVPALWVLCRGGQTTAGDAYAAFASVLAVWGFVEMTFLTGYVTGSRKTPCPPDCTGWRRVRFAIETIVYHELLLLFAGAVIFAVTYGGSRFAGALFAMLWLMRLSAKLNLFLGVPMLNAELLPPQLRHLRSYFRRRAMNALFPVSVIVSAIATGLLTERAMQAGASDYTVTAYILLASLLALGLLEHLFMVLPIAITGLWGPQIQARARENADSTEPAAPHPVPVADIAAHRARSQRIRSLGGIL